MERLISLARADFESYRIFFSRTCARVGWVRDEALPVEVFSLCTIA